MRTIFFANPFFCYIISFGISLFIYSWGWSDLYPALTTSVSLFLIITFIISIFFGLKIQRKIVYRKIEENIYNLISVIIIFFCYSLEFIYNGGIPIFTLLRGGDIEYMEFGIPTFHVVLHTFTSFYAIYIFHQYISMKTRKILFMFILLCLPSILIVNRGSLILILAACLILYLISIQKIIIKSLFKLLLIFLIFFFGFGYLGNQRSFNGDSAAFLKLTDANEKILDSLIPDEYYWFYMYASSPFANFQNATITSLRHRYDFSSFISWELLPDFISKRIVPIDEDYDGKNRLDYSINPLLTVGSIYFEPFIRLGWYGPIIVFIYYMVILFIYVKFFPPSSKYFLTAISILCVVSIFNMFENMLNFSGLSFQLVYPIFFSKIERYRLFFKGFRIKIFQK